MIRHLKRLAWRILDVLPLATICRRLQPVRTPLDVVLCIDIEPDDRLIRHGAPPEWPGFRQMTEAAGELRGRLNRISGPPVAFSWFVRLDPQVAEIWGRGWPLHHYRDAFAELEASGDSIGLHTHAWRWDPEADEWTVDRRREWSVHCLFLGLDTFEEILGRPCRAHRGGDRHLTGDMLALLGERGVKVDLTVEPGMTPETILVEGERSIGPVTSYADVPTKPYRSSPNAFPKPDPTGGDPLLIPVSAVPRGRYWSRWLLPATHQSLFALRLFVELMRRPRVLVFFLRTDPQHVGAMDLIGANLEHLARHRGVRITTAPAAASALAPGAQAEPANPPTLDVAAR